MSFVEDIRVNLSVRLASGTVKKIRAICGLGLEKPLANYDPTTRSWKMYEATLVSEDCPLLVNLPPSGMTRSGVLFLQRPWEPITGGIESLSWPTPISSSGMAEDIKTVKDRLDNGQKYKSRLVEAVAMYPTPTHGKMAGGTGAFNKVQALYSDGKISDEERKSMQAGNGGKLNPMWVEWLMGFPLGWTDLEDSETQ
jgi:hypothetical protein